MILSIRDQAFEASKVNSEQAGPAPPRYALELEDGGLLDGVHAR